MADSNPIAPPARKAPGTSRPLNQRRIAWATRGLAAAATLATAIFAAAAAHGTRVSSQAPASDGGTSAGGDSSLAQSADGDLWSPSLAPSESAPQQAYELQVIE